MKLVAVLLAFVAVITAGQTVGNTFSYASLIPNQTSIGIAPKVKGIRLKGKKLIVTGENFDDGARIGIDGSFVTTSNDRDLPTTTLIAKKGGKRIPDEGPFALFVLNSDGRSSVGFYEFFRTPSSFVPMLPRWPYPFSVELSAGDYLIVRDLETATRWFWYGGAEAFTRVFDTPLPSTAYWLYRAVRPGPAGLYAERAFGGERPPEVLYDIFILVE